MGIFSKFLETLGLANERIGLLVVGLDNSGKSTIVNRLKPRKGQRAEVVPTVGFQVEQFSRNHVSFHVFDMSGAGRYRNLWEHYLRDVQALLFVIDASDRLRLCVAKDELNLLLQHADLPRVPILFCANKMDCAGALSPVQCAHALQLDDIKDKPWNIVATNALTGEGLEEGLDWLTEALKRR